MKKLGTSAVLGLCAAFVMLPMAVFAEGKQESGGGMIKVGIVNLPPEESGYRKANVEDMNAVFSKANGYDAKQTNTLDNSEQIAAAQGYIRDGVDYLLISAANASGGTMSSSLRKTRVSPYSSLTALSTPPLRTIRPHSCPTWLQRVKLP